MVPNLLPILKFEVGSNVSVMNVNVYVHVNFDVHRNPIPDEL